jgi:NADH dehydrogenase
MTRTDLVTGAFGFTGRHIAQRLLDRGHALRTLTNHPQIAPAGWSSRVEVHPYTFENEKLLEKSLEGVHTLHNTYWVRFDRDRCTYEKAVRNTRALFHAAKRAGVERIVHVSIANAEQSQDLPYYRGKAKLEQELAQLGVPYAIVRPSVLFGDAGILINNIAWLLRNLPAFAIAGNGDYRLQPVFVEDLAELMVRLGDESSCTQIDAVGPEIYRYRDLVEHIRQCLGRRVPVLRLPTPVAYLCARAVGVWVRDVPVTHDELVGLQRDLLVSTADPTCPTKLSTWLDDQGDQLGARYLSELQMHYASAR